MGCRVVGTCLHTERNKEGGKKWMLGAVGVRGGKEKRFELDKHFVELLW